MKRRFIVKVSYAGQRYRGWQRQKNTPHTVQARLSEVINRAFEQTVDVQGASRTDAGVHARGQVASFDLDTALSPTEVMQQINHYLPADIALLAAQEVAPTFHVRHAVRQKLYEYTILEADKPDVFRRHTEWTVPGPLDLAKLEQALQPLLGQHDFAGFSVRRSKKTIRRIFDITVHTSTDDAGRRIVIRFQGDGFLHHMLRLIVGSAVAVGQGEHKTDYLGRILASKDRSLAILAPAQGLCLVQVDYALDFFGEQL